MGVNVWVQITLIRQMSINKIKIVCDCLHLFSEHRNNGCGVCKSQNNQVYKLSKSDSNKPTGESRKCTKEVPQELKEFWLLSGLI